MSESSRSVAERLRFLRLQADLSQEQAAAFVGLSFKYYQRLEGGLVAGIRLSTLDKITRAYAIDLAAFFAKTKPTIRKPQAIPPPHRRPNR